MRKTKICQICGDEFIPKSSVQKYCKKEIDLICSVCGKHYKGLCQLSNPTTCDDIECKKRAGIAGLHNTSKICRVCGKEFIPNSSRQLDCNREIVRKCVICGKEFTAHCSINDHSCTCSQKCQNQYIHQCQLNSYQDKIKKCDWCGKEFIPVNNKQRYCKNKHFRNCEICGKEFEVDLTKQDIPRTCSKECSIKLRFINGNPFSKPECREKAKQTSLERYGEIYPMRNIEVINKMKKAYLEKTGYIHQSHNPEVRSKVAKSVKNSKLEQRIEELFNNYKIGYIRHYCLSNPETNCSHEFDFYLPKYKLLIDADGKFYHAYLNDPNGKQSLDYYDDIRVSLVPKDHMFEVIVENNEEWQIKKITDMLYKIDHGIFDYNSYLFEWCRSIDFPYPEYTEKRLLTEWANLNKYENIKYIPTCRIGESIIKQYHKSIFDCRCGKSVSPKEAWYDDRLLKKVIKNRLIYVNNVDPSKILRGFNVSKICPVVSMFNPILAKYLVNKYLSDFDEVFDPFSGFSGRMLGAVATGRKYIGQDANKAVVDESNQIIEFLKLNNAKVDNIDLFNSSGKYQCMLTCPPYSNKEIYFDDMKILSCDEWIDECLSRFKCNRYVFVVDITEKYRDNIVEDLKSTSHFSNVVEKVVVIDR